MSADSYTPIVTTTRLSHPLNGSVFTTNRTVAAEKPLPALGGTMADEMGGAWAGRVIVEVAEIPSQAPGAQKDLRIVSAEIPSIEVQLASNWEYASCDIGGRKFSGVARTFIYPAADFSPATPALASAMPEAAEADPFTGLGYILVSRSAQRSGMNLEPVFRVERREYVRRTVMRDMSVDGLTGLPLPGETSIFHISEVPPGQPNGGTATAGDLLQNSASEFWGLQTDGNERAGSSLSSEWVEITTRKVIGGTVNEQGIIDIGSYGDIVNFHWPAVLENIIPMRWARRDGGEDIHNRVIWKRDAYSGPCSATISRAWSKAPPSAPLPTPLVTTSIHYSSPYFNVHVPECLHALVTLICDTGTADPIYKQNTNSLATIPATEHLDWPPTLVAGSEVRPYRGGYLLTTTTVTAPIPPP